MTTIEADSIKTVAKALATATSVSENLYRSSFLKLKKQDLVSMDILLSKLDNGLAEVTRDEVRKVVREWSEAKTEEMLWVVMVCGTLARRMEQGRK